MVVPVEFFFRETVRWGGGLFGRIGGFDLERFGRGGGAGVDDEICPYATFHLLGFREEMDPNKASASNQFQTFPHPPNGANGVPHESAAAAHHRQGSQSMVGPSLSFPRS